MQYGNDLQYGDYLQYGDIAIWGPPAVWVLPAIWGFYPHFAVQYADELLFEFYTYYYVLYLDVPIQF